MKLILPIILVIAALGLFVLYTNPAYQNIKGLSAQAASYDDALNKAAQLRALRDQLLSKRNTFANDDVNKLGQVLPDNVDNIRLIIDIDNIASRHNLTLSGVQLGDVSDARTARAASAVGASGDPVGSVEVGFTVVGTYDDFLAFLQDVEHSLRIIDVDKIGFQSSTGTTVTYTVSIRTYWLH